jgi:ethanolaminephosphotransferase
MDITIRLARHIARSIATFDTEQKVRKVEIESTDQNRMFGTIAVLPLCGTAFVFKLAFTAKDAPELTAGISEGLMERTEMLELVGLARMVFGGLLLSGIWITISEWTRSNRRKRRGAQGNGGMS